MTLGGILGKSSLAEHKSNDSIFSIGGCKHNNNDTLVNFKENSKNKLLFCANRLL